MMVPTPFTSLLASGRDWLTLLLLGVFAEWTHRHSNVLVQWALGWVVVKATFKHTDPSHKWLILWLTKQPSWRQNRNFYISTLAIGVEDGIAVMNSPPRNLSDRTNLFLLPENNTTYHAWFKWCFIRFWVDVDQDLRRSRQELHLEIYTRTGPSLLVELLKEAEQAYRSLEIGSITVHRAQRAPWGDFEWGSSGTKRARPLESVVLEEGVSDKLLGDVKEFLGSQEWYRQRGIPFRRGYLMYGPPGTGKTSFVAALAAELELDIYLLSLGGLDLDDCALISLLAQVPSRAILLIEDIGASQRGVSGQDRTPAPNSDLGNSQRHTVTLGGLLNALDGVEASEGRLLFATTNHKDALDPALCRPGRMDVHVEFGMASSYQATQPFKRFYPEHEFGVAATGPGTKDVPPIPSRSSLSSSRPISRQGSVKSQGSEHTDDLAVAVSSVAEEMPVFMSSTPIQPPQEQQPHLSARHRAPEDPGLDIKSLASRFASVIPERTCTMATLQEYLMGYKRDPLGASREGNVKDFLHRLGVAEAVEVESERDTEELVRAEANYVGEDGEGVIYT